MMKSRCHTAGFDEGKDPQVKKWKDSPVLEPGERKEIQSLRV